MITRGIRGAITVEHNTPEDIGAGVIELLTQMVKQNHIEIDDISHAIFSMTPDLNADFPAKYARVNLRWDEVPMMCFSEIDVPNGLPKCIRVLIVVNCGENFEPEFVYLKGAANLRK